MQLFKIIQIAFPTRKTKLWRTRKRQGSTRTVVHTSRVGSFTWSCLNKQLK